MQIERTVYESTYELLHSVVRHKTVPELAVGTGFSAKNIVPKPEKTLAEIRKALKENDVLTLDTANRTAVQMRAKTGRKGQRSRMRARTSRSWT